MAKNNATPIIDPRVQFRGTTVLRTLNVAELNALDGPIVLQDGGGNRLAVLVPYEQYLTLQDKAR